MPKLCVIPGDGIGQEVIPAAVQVLRAVIPDLETVEMEAGWDCFLQQGTSVPPQTLAAIVDCGAALFGAVSSPPQQVTGYRSAILTMRQALNLYANIRPVRSWPRVSPRPDINMIIVRENTEGLYVGREWLRENSPSAIIEPDAEVTAVAERIITRSASRRLAQKARFLMQVENRRKLTIVHKANVLPITDGLFRNTVREVFKVTAPEAKDEYTMPMPQFEVDELLVDVAALKMVSEPERFDVIVTTNLFGDILSDAAAHWGGGLGLAPSLNWGEGVAIAEPVHGSAPDIAGQGVANPIAAILSGALLARYVWGLAAAAAQIETAVYTALAQGNLWYTDAITQTVLDGIKNPYA